MTQALRGSCAAARPSKSRSLPTFNLQEPEEDRVVPHALPMPGSLQRPEASPRNQEYVIPLPAARLVVEVVGTIAFAGALPQASAW